MFRKVLICSIFFSSPATASEIVYQFKNPSFSGIGTGAHWLTVENQETTRKKAIQEKIEAMGIGHNGGLQDLLDSHM